MTRPKVSIIVPVYNVEKYFDRCMQSLMNQTLREIEIILVDDKSPDNCPAMCDEYAKQDSRIKVIHKKNGGLGYARNSGMEIATGEYVAFVDSDDFVDVEMYENLYNIARKKKIDTVYSGFDIISMNGNISNSIIEFSELTFFENENQIKNFLLDMVGMEYDYPKDRKIEMCVWRAIYSTEIIKRNNIFFNSEREFISEDIIFHIDYLPNTQKIAYTPDVFYHYCKNEESLTGKFKTGRFAKDKILHNEIKRKLSLLYSPEEYNIRVDRSFIGYIRSCVYKRSTAGISHQVVKKEIQNICFDNDLQATLKHFKYSRLPLKQYLLTIPIRFKLIDIILLLRKYN